MVLWYFFHLAPIYSILEESLMEPIDMSGPATSVLWLYDSEKERGVSYLFLIVPKNALSRRTWVITIFDFSSIFTLNSHIFWYFGPELNNFFRSAKNYLDCVRPNYTMATIISVM